MTNNMKKNFFFIFFVHGGNTLLLETINTHSSAVAAFKEEDQTQTTFIDSNVLRISRSPRYRKTASEKTMYELSHVAVEY